MNCTNQQILLMRHPQGAPRLDDFKLSEAPLRALEEGEILLKTLCFSLDPYMRGRMSGIKTYIEPFALGEVIVGLAVCTVEESKSDQFQVGDRLLTFTGWQKYAIYKPTELPEGQKASLDSPTKLPLDVKPSYFLDVLGMTGFTAYSGLMKIGQPKAGETVVVSAATGAVGSIVGQLAKLQGCRVVGIAGGATKCRYAVETLGFDACLDHHSKTLTADLKAACPAGIDIYFENIGGPTFWVVFQQLNPFARVPICGAIAWYNDLFTLQKPKGIFSKILPFIRVFCHFDKTPAILSMMIGKRIKMQGLLVTDFYEQFNDFLDEMSPLLMASKIIMKEDIVIGLENAPQAFIGLLEGKNFGKMIIEIP
jgi:NADPH-dependent curcumin reductase CurA